MKYTLVRGTPDFVINIKGYKRMNGFNGSIVSVSVGVDEIELQNRVEGLGFKKVGEGEVYRTKEKIYDYEKDVQPEEVEEFYYMDIMFIFNDDDEAEIENFYNNGKMYMRCPDKKKKEEVLASLTKKVETRTLKFERRPDLGYIVSDAIDPADIAKITKGVVGYKTSYKPECYAMEGVEFSRNKRKYEIGKEKIVLMFDDFDEEAYEKLQPNLKLEIEE